MRRVFRWLGRIGAVICLVLMIPATAVAFWVFNANQVLFKPDTYRTALHTSAAEEQILTALMNGFGANAPYDALELVRQLPPPALDQFSTVMFPPSEAGMVVDGVINPLSQWLNGQTDQPQIMIDLTRLKANLTSTSPTGPALTLASTLADNLPGCGTIQMGKLAAFASGDRSYKDFPICSPSHQIFPANPAATSDKTATPRSATRVPAVIVPATPSPTRSAGVSQASGNTGNGISAGNTSGSNTPRSLWIAYFTQGLSAIASALPNQWSFATGANTLNDNRPFNGGRFTPTQVNTIRATIWLQQRLLIVLFLVPIGLLCLIVILTIRTTKQLFRWTGVALILGGLVSLLPIVVLALRTLDPTQVQVFPGAALGIDQLAINALARGAVESVVSALSQVVFYQVAALIGVGMICLILSIIIAPPLNWPPDDRIYAGLPKPGNSETATFIPKRNP